MFCITQDENKIIRDGYDNLDKAERALEKLERELNSETLMIMRTERALKMGYQRSFV